MGEDWKLASLVFVFSSKPNTRCVYNLPTILAFRTTRSCYLLFKPDQFMRMNNVFHRWEWSSVPRNRSHQPSLHQNQRRLSSSRPELLGAWLAPTSIHYHRNVWVLILIKNWLALTILWAAGPRMLWWNRHGRVVWKFGIIWVEKAQITARERFGPLALHWSKFTTVK